MCVSARACALGGIRAEPAAGPLLSSPLPQPSVAMRFLWQRHPQTQLSPII